MLTNAPRASAAAMKAATRRRFMMGVFLTGERRSANRLPIGASGPGYGGKFRGCRKPNAGWPLRGGQPASKRCEASSDGVGNRGEQATQRASQQRYHGDQDGRDQGDEQAVLNGRGALGGLAEALLRDDDECGEVSGNGSHVG